MDEAERFLMSVGGGLEDCDPFLNHDSSSMEKLEKKRTAAAKNFIGSGRSVKKSVVFPHYYADLLAWALDKVLKQDKWQVTETMGYDRPDAVFIEVTTDYDQTENLLGNGRLLVQKGTRRMVITIDGGIRGPAMMIAEGPSSKGKLIEEFVNNVAKYGKEKNFLRYKRFEFGVKSRLINVKEKDWENVIIDSDVKKDIRANTIDFLGKSQIWEKYGIAARRGILLAGEPGTGKTIVCKALMSEAKNITCIVTNSSYIREPEYLSDLYEVAEELKPSLVFIEDIDLIGQNRDASLVSLLAILDGVEESKEIVTVATTNYLETLDMALSERPSRFDRVIKLTRPALDERLRLIQNKCLRIPISQEIQEYIARKSTGCTPAQIQEIVHSLVIDNIQKGGDCEKKMVLSRIEIDKAVSRISGMGRHPIGFRSSDRSQKE